ncbi:MAG: fluoride efflux transporter CrcB [Gemmatimonadota bacterium]|nr:fluoride efflux transporter CrcB [Gemmatimonadota bacterium]
MSASINLVLYIALGSAAGGVSRFLLASAIQERANSAFPMGTLVVNITGSLLLGFIFSYALQTTSVSAEMRAFLTTGFCGGYTTFSAFSYETARLMQQGLFAQAAAYVGTSVSLSVAGVFVGFALARRMLGAGG